MRQIEVVPIGRPERPLLGPVVSTLAREFGTRCTITERTLDTSFAHHPERDQYLSTGLVEKLAQTNGTGNVVVGVTELDLYIPILTFVFGEAQLGGNNAVVSYHRLTQEFYGLPADAGTLQERLVKEAVHEVGHTYGLTHCEDYECVMAASHGIEALDLKTTALCPYCRHLAGL
jgi:archaemetzincin